MENPYAVKNSQDGQMLQIYLGSSPSPFCPNGRSDDLSILTHAISQADEFVYVAVSDYAPMNVFGKDRKPWPILDDLLREGLYSFFIIDPSLIQHIFDHESYIKSKESLYSWRFFYSVLALKWKSLVLIRI